MASAEILTAAAAGALLGGVLMWALGVRARRALAEKSVASATELAVVTERLRAREHELQGQVADALRLGGELASLRERLQQEAELRAGAEATAGRLPDLEEEATAQARRVAGLQEDVRRLDVERQELTTRLEEERRATVEKIALLDEARTRLADAFTALAAQALHANSQQFLELARGAVASLQAEGRGELVERQAAIESMVGPLKESLGRVDAQIQEMERARQHAYGALGEQVRALTETQDRLQRETANLVKALRQPQVRGRWGEMQLRRVVEMAGMLAHCDFVEQESVDVAGGRLRPDLVVRLPGGKNVVVDAKAPLRAFLDAVDAADDADRKHHAADHARLIRSHMARLADKAYWQQFEPTPEFVVMFLPGEMFFSAALEQEPGLIEEGVLERVIPASPTTLIALLRAVAYGWRQETLAENAQQISNLGKELYERLRTLAEHFIGLGKGLERAIKSYNDAVGSLEGRVLVTARRFPALGVAAQEEIPVLEPVEVARRSLRELSQEAGSGHQVVGSALDPSAVAALPGEGAAPTGGGGDEPAA